MEEIQRDWSLNRSLSAGFRTSSLSMIKVSKSKEITVVTSEHKQTVVRTEKNGRERG